MPELVGGVLLVFALQIFFLIRYYKRCPADKVLVVSGKTQFGDKLAIYDGGGVFVWPLLQEFAYLDRRPLKLTATAPATFTADGVQATVSINLLVAIGGAKEQLEVAVKRLLSLSRTEISDLGKQVANSELPLVVSALASVELTRPERLKEAIYVAVNKGLRPLGLEVLNVEIADISLQHKATDTGPALSSRAANVARELKLSKPQMNSLINGKAVEVVIPPGEERFVRILAPKPTN